MITEMRTETGEDRGFFDRYDGYGVLLDQWDDELLMNVAAEFPAVASPLWENVCNEHEHFLRSVDKRLFLSHSLELINLLGSDGFIGLLSELADIDGLIFDKNGSFLQAIPFGGYVGLHAGPNLISTGWGRISVQVFLNNLSDDQSNCDVMIYDNPDPFPDANADLPSNVSFRAAVKPEFNLTAIVETRPTLFHGQPISNTSVEPIKSVVANYYTKGAPPYSVVSSNKVWWRS